ncbi:hypothetical protein DUI87_22180 [Hirundo rustica rustica]|uniref:Uncharacterized protein n=1 Tax=Hirundo rustica rustica TaxID=333673 RepID=A0A3M0JLQ6_HIRRU|nr:hypothetical protein DUI87_22180 [Hirundo rustica rustica]
MDQERACAVDEELSPWADVRGRELRLWEEVTVREFRQWEEEVAFQEISPYGAAGHPELHHRHIVVRMQGADVGQQELSQWGESATVQGLQQWDEDEYDRSQELSLWEGEVTGQELYPWVESVTVKVQPELYQWDEHEDNRYQELSLWEGEVTGQELSPWAESVTVQVQPELYQWDEHEDNRYQELSLWEGEVTGQELYPWAESVKVQVQPEPYQWDEHEDNRHQELSLWEEDVTGQEEVAGPWKGQGYQELYLLDEDVQGQWEEVKRDIELGQVGVKSHQDLTQGKDASIQELPQWETHVSEEPCRPLAAKGEMALGYPALGQELAWAEPQGLVPAPWNPPGGSQVLLDSVTCSSCGPVNTAVLEVQGSGQQPGEQKPLEPTQPSHSLQEAQALPGQPVPYNERPSLFRRAMRRLCCCLVAQPED